MADDWRQILQMASNLRRADRVREAIDAYRKVLTINPALADSWYNLGWLLKRDRQFEAALEAYDRALALGIREPEEVHLNRAVIFADNLARPEDAAAELAAALKLNPDYGPALLNLGNLREDLGDRSGAQEAYQRALSAEPENARALARLAGVSHSDDLNEELASRLRRALGTAASPAVCADLRFALAGLLDAGGRYEEAFEAAREANRASAAADGARYDQAAHQAFVDRLIAPSNAPPPSRGPNAAPIFICGMYRSGSTLVEQILGAHDQITAFGELDLIPALAQGIEGYPEALRHAGPTQLEQWRAFYMDALPKRTTPLFTDKRPDNFLHIGLIKTLFPAAKIVHTRRTPLDNLLSLYFLHLDPSMAYALDLRDAAHWYCEYERLMEHWDAVYSNDIFALDYDALVRQPETVIRALLQFLGLQWDDGLLNFHLSNSVVKTASVWQVRKPLHGRSSGRWRNYEKQLQPIARLLRQCRPKSPR